MKQGEADFGDTTISAGDGPHWLRELVVAGAEASNRNYEKLIAHYDIGAGVVDPPAGLDVVSRRLLAETIMRATRGLTFVLSRAIAEANVAPPEVALTIETVLAALKIPVKMLAKRLSDAEDRRVVEAMYDELKATGTVEHALPEDDRIVRDAHRQDVLERQLAARAEQRAAVVKRIPLSTPAPKPVAKEAALSPQKAHLAMSDVVERAPSIGPKTAERLEAVGIKTVADLLAADPADLAGKLDVRHIDAGTIRDWQDQARLVTSVPGLRGTQAQLLVGAGYRTPASAAAARPEKICADLLAFAATTDGQRLLRDGGAPDVERIASLFSAGSTTKAA